MKELTTRQFIKEYNIKFKELWDKPSKKGSPTKDSVLITIAMIESDNSDGMLFGGFAVKLPNDEPISRIGKAIAVRNLRGSNFDVFYDSPEQDTLDFFECYPTQHFSNKIRERIKFICGIREGIIGIK